MHKKQNLLPIILQGLMLIVIISASLFYLFKTRPEQIKKEIKASCEAKLIQYKKDATRQSNIERNQHQSEIAKLSDEDREKPENIYMIEKWSNENVKKSENQLVENFYKRCISAGGK
jgi:hypothetical protein